MKPPWLAVILAMALLIQWAPGRWPAALLQFVLFLATAWRLVACWRAGSMPRLHRLLLTLAFLRLWGGIQMLSGMAFTSWKTSESILDWLAYLCAAFLALRLGAEQDGPRRFRLAVLCFGVALAPLCVAQAWTSEGRVFWLFESGYHDRVFGPFVYHNKFAQFLELVLPLALFQALEDRRHASFWLAAATMLFSGIVASASRSGFALALVELGLLLSAVAACGRLRGRRLALPAAALGVMAACGGWLAGWDALAGRLTTLDPRLDPRLPIWSSALRMFGERPLMGFGLGSWIDAYPRFATFDLGLVVNTAHNDWLQWAVEGGLPALAAMLFFVVLITPAAFRSLWGTGALIVLAHGLLDYPMHQSPAFTALVISLAVLPLADGKVLDP